MREEELWETVTLLMDHTVQTRDMALWTAEQKAKEIKRRAKMFHLQLGHFEADVVNAAAVAYLGRISNTDGRNGGGKFFPSSSELLECIRDILADAAGVPSAEEAWMQVKQFASRYGRDEFPSVEKWSHPLAREAAAAIGWRIICVGDESSEEFRRHSYLQAYRNLVDRAQRQQMMAPVVRATVEQLAAAMGRPKQLGAPTEAPTAALPAPSDRNYEQAQPGADFKTLAGELHRYISNLPPMPKRGERG